MALKDEQLKKAISKVVDEVLGTEPSEENGEEEINKAMPASMDENGGKDKIKSGTPYSDKQKMKKAKKEEEEEESEEKKAKMKKSDDEEKPEEEKVTKSEGEETTTEEEAPEETTKVAKSIEELTEVLDEDELELIKAWRADKEAPEENVETEIKEEITKAKKAEETKEYEDLKKAYSEQSDLIKSLSEKIDKMASQPAYDKRSIENLETIEKSQPEEKISKSQVLDKMLELQQTNKGVRAVHISEFEATNNISDPAIKKMVMDSLK